MPPSRRSRPERARHRLRKGSLSCRFNRRATGAAHARRQYDAVDPANRLMAGELERRWNEALQAIHRIEGDIAAIVAAKPTLGEGATATHAARRRPRAGMVASRRHSRYAQADIAHGAQRDRGAQGRRGHQHGSSLAGWRSHCPTSQAEIECCRSTYCWPLREDTIALVRELAFDAGSTDRTPPQSFRQADWVWQRMDGAARARLPQTPTLRFTGTTNGLSAPRSRSMPAAWSLALPRCTALRMVEQAISNGRQACKGAPWVIKADVAAVGARKRSTGPVTASAQQTLKFQ